MPAPGDTQDVFRVGQNKLLYIDAGFVFGCLSTLSEPRIVLRAGHRRGYSGGCATGMWRDHRDCNGARNCDGVAKARHDAGVFDLDGASEIETVQIIEDQEPMR